MTGRLPESVKPVAGAVDTIDSIFFRRNLDALQLALEEREAATGRRDLLCRHAKGDGLVHVQVRKACRFVQHMAAKARDGNLSACHRRAIEALDFRFGGRPIAEVLNPRPINRPRQAPIEAPEKRAA